MLSLRQMKMLPRERWQKRIQWQLANGESIIKSEDDIEMVASRFGNFHQLRSEDERFGWFWYRSFLFVECVRIINMDHIAIESNLAQICAACIYANAFSLPFNPLKFTFSDIEYDQVPSFSHAFLLTLQNRFSKSRTIHQDNGVPFMDVYIHFLCLLRP